MLKTLSDPTCDVRDALSARDEVYKRVPGGSKSAISVWLRRLSRASAMTLGGRHDLTHIAQIVRERLERGPTADGNESDSDDMYDGESDSSEQDEEDRPSPKRGAFDARSFKSSGTSGSKSKAATRKAQLDTLLSSAMQIFEVGQTVTIDQCIFYSFESPPHASLHFSPHATRTARSSTRQLASFFCCD